mmetsp:Transcript_99543/g.277071  ORF Transcript_99543/g.277071 Transcript_99543/m.277071 type:complete len:209 (-) Transcript_99543:631-1257(-)
MCAQSMSVCMCRSSIASRFSLSSISLCWATISCVVSKRRTDSSSWRAASTAAAGSPAAAGATAPAAARAAPFSGAAAPSAPAPSAAAAGSPAAAAACSRKRARQPSAVSARQWLSGSAAKCARMSGRCQGPVLEARQPPSHWHLHVPPRKAGNCSASTSSSNTSVLRSTSWRDIFLIVASSKRDLQVPQTIMNILGQLMMTVCPHVSG